MRALAIQIAFPIFQLALAIQIAFPSTGRSTKLFGLHHITVTIYMVARGIANDGPTDRSSDWNRKLHRDWNRERFESLAAVAIGIANEGPTDKTSDWNRKFNRDWNRERASDWNRERFEALEM